MLAVTQSVKAQGFNIVGEVNGLDSPALLFLMQQDGIVFEKVVVNNGNFSFEGEVDEPYFVQILMLESENGFNTTGKLTEFLVENSEIRIEGTSPAFEDVNVYGSESDLVLKEYLGKDNHLSKKWHRIKTDYDQAVENEESEIVQELRNTLKNLTAERVMLLKSYVNQYNSSIIGALIPNFCLLENVLTRDDYREMYDLLSPKMQETRYGSSILGRSKE